MMILVNPPRPAGSTDDSAERIELRRRMRRPQRHRLLHGYPLAAAMPRIAEDRPRDTILPEFDPRRGLLVGVLPHPFCNPAVTGCGFCTFPHEAFTSRKAAVVIDHVVREIEQTTPGSTRPRGTADRRPLLRRRHGQSQPAGAVRRLCRALPQAFDLSAAEVTLEGVPAAFLNRRPCSWTSSARNSRPPLPPEHGHPDVRSGPAEADGPARLRRCRHVPRGRRLGHARGFTVSGDLLFNLPAQSLER